MEFHVLDGTKVDVLRCLQRDRPLRKRGRFGVVRRIKDGSVGRTKKVPVGIDLVRVPFLLHLADEVEHLIMLDVGVEPGGFDLETHAGPSVVNGIMLGLYILEKRLQTVQPVVRAVCEGIGEIILPRARISVGGGSQRESRAILLAAARKAIDHQLAIVGWELWFLYQSTFKKG